MNIEFAKEVGIFNYILRRIAWRMGLAPRTITLPTGNVFPLPSNKFFASDVYVTQANVDWNSEYILAAYLKTREEKREFLDVGAHLGYYASLVAPLCSQVFAFEPDARNRPFLSETGKHVPNLTIVAKAVSNRNGTSEFSDSDESSVSHIVEPTGKGIPSGTTTVETVTIDAFVAEKKIRPVAVKIDIEGFDILALRGAAETARVHQPVFLVEYNLEQDRPNTWEGLDRFVRETGYRIHAVTRAPEGPFGFGYSFRPFTTRELQEHSVKMIFLIPESSRAWFDAFSSETGGWGIEALRPQGVAKLLERFDPR